MIDLDEWAFPATDWEAEMVRQIESLPAVTAHRVSAARLKWMRMKPRQCHANAVFMERNDPAGKMCRVIGWMPDSGVYVLHSVVRHGGGYACVTPVDPRLGLSSRFAFIPDPAIEARRVGDHECYYRGGVAIGPGLRADPTRTLADIEEVRRRLRAGWEVHAALGNLPG